MLREMTNTRTLPVRAWLLLSCLALVVLTISSLAAVSSSAAQETSGVRVIVRADNPIEQLPRSEVVRIFMGQVPTWKDGTRVRPVDQSLTSPVRKEFADGVMKQSLLVVEHYWRQQIFAGRATPPPVRDTNAAVAEFVSASPGAIGYVSVGYSLPAGVRALAISD
jgi:ABC-type phosphate transport system substrate-binding protein